MKFVPNPIGGSFQFYHDVNSDARGWFRRQYCEPEFAHGNDEMGGQLSLLQASLARFQGRVGETQASAVAAELKDLFG